MTPQPGPHCVVEGPGGFGGPGGGVGLVPVDRTPCTTLCCLLEGGTVALTPLLAGLEGAGHTVGTPWDGFESSILHRTEVSRGSHTRFSPQGPHWQRCPVRIKSFFPLPLCILLVLQGVCQMPPPPGSCPGFPLTQALGPKDLPVPHLHNSLTPPHVTVGSYSWRSIPAY